MRALFRNWPVILGLTLALGLFFLTRIPNLTGLPIFTDEAIYIRWSQIGFRDANWRFISLTDGKQPMFTWLMMVLFKVFEGADPLFVGRFTSVIAGAFTMLGIWVLSYELFRDKRASWIAAFLYIILPFSVWYDRVALYDSLVATFSVWNLYLAVRLAKKPRLDTALLLGMLLGAGMLNKSSGFLTLYFLPVTLLVFDWKGSSKFARLARWIGFAAVAALLSQVVYSVLRLSPFFHMVGQKDNVFVFSLREWLNQPFRFFAGNLRGMFDWLRQYMTLPLFIVAIVPFFSRWPKFRERLLLYLWWALPFAALANFAKILYPRFILFMSMPLLILAAVSLARLLFGTTRVWVRAFLAIVLIVPAMFITSVIVLRPEEAPIPFADRGQFIENWPAGGGVREVVALLRAEGDTGNISVYTEGTFGLMPYALEIYLVDHPNIKITGIWPLPVTVPPTVASDAERGKTFLVMNETQVAPPGWPITLIGEYTKGSGLENIKLRLYRVQAQPSIAL